MAPANIPILLAAFPAEDFHPFTSDPLSQPLMILARKARDARTAADRAAENEWDLRTGLEIYKTSGKHSPAWDALVMDAMKNDVPPAESYRKYKAAVDAGCADPLVRYYSIRRGVAAKIITPLAAIPQYQALLPDMDNSPYTPGRKFQLRIQILHCCLEQQPNNIGATPRLFEWLTAQRSTSFPIWWLNTQAPLPSVKASNISAPWVRK